METVIMRFQEQLAESVPELRYIDEDWGQMDYYQRPPVQFPGVLIDIQNGVFTNDGQLQQKGTLIVAVKLYVLSLSNSSHQAPQKQKELTQEGWKIYRKINQALHGQHFLGEGFATPIRVSMQRVKRQDGIYERDIVYSIAFTDSSTVPVRETTTAQPTIKARLKTTE